MLSLGLGLFLMYFRYTTRVPDNGGQHPSLFKMGVPLEEYRGN